VQLAEAEISGPPPQQRVQVSDHPIQAYRALPPRQIARLPDLQPWPLMDMDFATSCPLVRPVAASYPVAVRQVAISLHVSFRRSLAVPPSRSLVLHLHQVAQGTFTPRLLDMPSTQDAARRASAVAFGHP
jgi:hypothetical protein